MPVAEFQAISPPVYVFTGHLDDDDGAQCLTVYGWWSADGWSTFEPVVGNPDGPGIGPWHRFYGEDPWRTG